MLALAALAAAVMGQGLATCDEAGLAPCSAAVSLCVANSGGDPTALCGACVVARGCVCARLHHTASRAVAAVAMRSLPGQVRHVLQGGG